MDNLLVIDEEIMKIDDDEPLLEVKLSSKVDMTVRIKETFIQKSKFVFRLFLFKFEDPSN